MPKSTALILWTALIMMISAGCYTVLQHPGVEETYSGEDYQADCLGCHPDYHEYPYGYFYGTYPDYWWSSPRWGHYYAYPWWWDYYWYPRREYHDDSDEFVPRSTRGKKAVRRESLRPPYSTGTTTIRRSENGADQIKGGDSSGKQSDSSDSEQTKEKKEKKKDNTKATRRGGGRKSQ
jgi:hypothetical protein